MLKTVKRATPKPFNLTVEFYREADGRWLAYIPELPGVTVYGRTKKQALV
jgi:predicted RNase H-like HicB family nuclease